MMSNETTKMVYKEEVKVEDWIGDDSDERQARGDPPDRVETFTHWYDGEVEITDPDRILALEASIAERK